MSKLYAVGIGPGSPEQMTELARRTLASCEAIVGYTVYIDLVREAFPGKEYITTPMRQEKERCRLALESARQGKSTAMICSGDPGVYGMAGLLYELSEEYPGVEIEVIPGVTSATAGAALLGAPLMHDFAVISLSDALTPWELIEKRLRAAASSELILCLYNPESRKRPGYLKRACEIVLEYLPPETICGIARQIGREGETWQVMSLAQLAQENVDMFTTVYIGNRTTKKLGVKMITPRGY